jgi:hypothetical protein
MFKHGFHFSHRADPFSARELVDFRRDDRTFRGRRLQPRPCVEIVLETWMPRIQEQQTQKAWAASWVGYLPHPPEVRLRQRPEFGACRRAPLRCAARTALRPRVPEARQIHEVKGRARVPFNPVYVGEPCLAGCRTCARDLLAHERVDQARLADVRSADHGDLRETVARQIAGARSARYEGGGGFQKRLRAQDSWLRHVLEPWASSLEPASE